MSFTQIRLVGPSTLLSEAAPLTTYYTVAAGKTVIIKQVVVTNTTTTDRTFSLYINNSSSALFKDTTVKAKDTVIIDLSQVLTAGETILAQASVSSALNLTISGVLNDGPLNPLSTYIADSAITETKLATNSVTESKISDGAITSNKVASTQTNITSVGSLTSLTVNGTTNINGATYINNNGIVVPWRQVKVTSNSNIGTAISLDETAYGGIDWAMISTGTGATQGAGEFLIYRPASDGGSGSLRINSSGHVRMPYQPAFFVSNENGAGISAVNKHTFNIVAVNNGSHWSAANNRFTAPVAGIYFITYSILNASASAFYVSIRKNGVGLSLGYYPRSYCQLQYESNTASGYVSLASGDYIELWVETGTAHTYHSFFSGHLVA